MLYDCYTQNFNIENHIFHWDPKRSTALITAKNRLLELPDSLGLLRNLQRLDVSENLLSTLPKPLEDLQELVTLDVHGNHLTEVPPSLGLLKNLTEFDCTGNPFSEPINTFYSQVIYIFE